MSIKRNLWKVGIAIAGMLLLLVFMMWLSVPAAGAQGGVSESATPGTAMVQATPTVDATVTALNKEKLMQEVQQLQQSNNRGLSNWLWSYAAVVLSSFLSTLVIVIGALIGFRQWSVGRKDTQKKEADDRIAAQTKELEDRKAERERRDEEQKRWLEDRKAERERRDEEQQRWLEDHKAEREKRAEERFQAAIEGLSSEREEAKIGAAILLRTFLRPGYEQFYTQTFDLAVAHLRLPGTPHLPVSPDTPLPLTTLRQALIVVFKEAFPLARSQNKGSIQQVLDASGTQLDNANLNYADLEKAWMPQASLQEANLYEAILSEANLAIANLSGANLLKADLNEASLFMANLSEAKLHEAKLHEAKLHEAILFTANLSGADLSGADLSNARHLDTATSLERTDLRGVKGLTKEQLKAYEARGAIIDEDSTAISSQPTVAPPQPEPDNDEQTQSTSPAQGSVPTLDAVESSTTSPSPES